MTIPHLGAFESTKIHGAGVDILGTTRHIEKWRSDLDLLRAAQLTGLRYSIPWHRIERSPGVFDFSWMDGPMNYMRQHGMKPIVDLIHHTSFPDWLENGFANIEFPALFHRFADQFFARYEWVELCTIFNEPLATTLLCSYMGVWYPHLSSDFDFVQMGLNVGRAICAVDHLLRRKYPHVNSVYVDTCELHQAVDRRSEPWVKFAQSRRFWIADLILGRIDSHHPLLAWLRTNGFSPEEMSRFQQQPASIDILGLDYYAHSEIDWYWNREKGRADISWPVANPRGFSAVASEYVDRYGLPVMLSETNLRGTVSDRVTWLKFMEEQCEALVHSGVDFRGFCWYPSIDSTDWCNLCCRCTNQVDPQGIWLLDETRWKRQCSELSEQYTRLAMGRARSRDVSAYRFSKPLDRHLAGYVKLMSHWEHWRDSPEMEVAA